MAETVHLDLKVIFRRLNQMRLLSSSKILWLSEKEDMVLLYIWARG